MDASLQYSSADQLNSRFQPNQIVCLEHAEGRLYAEVVQLIAVKHACWVHPLGLILRSPTSSTSFEEFGSDHDPTDFTVYDLRQGADLVWPTILFRAALDIEVLPLLSKLYQPIALSGPEAAQPPQPTLVARQSLNRFVREIWQAHAEVFNPAV
jgi:hypothetical protein